MSPLPNGSYRFWPGSDPAELGVPYTFEIGVHCDIDLLVDFDGSFWDLESSTDPQPTNAPYPLELTGTMTLVTEDRAEFTAEDRFFVFSRRDGPKDIRLCS